MLNKYVIICYFSNRFTTTGFILCAKRNRQVLRTVGSTRRQQSNFQGSSYRNHFMLDALMWSINHGN